MNHPMTDPFIEERLVRIVQMHRERKKWEDVSGEHKTWESAYDELKRFEKIYPDRRFRMIQRLIRDYLPARGK